MATVADQRQTYQQCSMVGRNFEFGVVVGQLWGTGWLSVRFKLEFCIMSKGALTDYGRPSV